MVREHITNRAHGLDISPWQETYDYSKTFGQVDFAIQKMTEGTWWDSSYGKLWDLGTSQVSIRGMYHYQRSGVSWKAQADNILNMINRVSPKIHIVALDIEKINNILDATYFADSGRILNYLSQNCDRKVIMYVNTDVFNTMYPKYFGLHDGWMFDYDMWLAQYWNITSPDKNPSLPSGRKDWKIWQYTDSGDSYDFIDGVKMRRYGSPDLNVFNGTVEEMMVWAGIQGSNEIPPTLPNPEKDPYTKLILQRNSGNQQIFIKQGA